MFTTHQPCLLLALFLLSLTAKLGKTVPIEIEPIVVGPHPEPGPAPEPAPEPAPGHPVDPSSPETPGSPHSGPDPNPAPDPNHPSSPEKEGTCAGKRGLGPRAICGLPSDDAKAIQGQIKLLDKVGKTKILADGGNRWPTSRVETLGNEQLALGLAKNEELTGCTVMVATNEHGDVYMAHIWEVPAFRTDKTNGHNDVRPEKEFTDFLQNGQATSSTDSVPWKGEPLNQAKFKDADTHITWLTPGNEVEGRPQYGKRLDAAEKKITDWLGSSATFERHVYQRPEDNETGSV